ncbi:glutamate receptor ionotropic, partial [Striga asiatica]
RVSSFDSTTLNNRILEKKENWKNKLAGRAKRCERSRNLKSSTDPHVEGSNRSTENGRNNDCVPSTKPRSIGSKGTPCSRSRDDSPLKGKRARGLTEEANNPHIIRLEIEKVLTNTVCVGKKPSEVGKNISLRSN